MAQPGEFPGEEDGVALRAAAPQDVLKDDDFHCPEVGPGKSGLPDEITA
jgi:hypothetical protein